MDRLPEHRRAVQTVFERALSPPATRLAVTGATGWLGKALVEMAARAGLSPKNGRLRAFASKPGRLVLEGGTTLDLEALADAAPLTGEGWTVAHFAALGKERTVDLSTADYVAQSEALHRAALRLISRADRPRLIFASSGAVYGPNGTPPSLADEPYGHTKGLHEVALADWCGTNLAPLTICRVFNVGGPYGNKLDLYALSSLIRSALAGGDIPIRAQGPVLRSYVHVEELMALLVGQAQSAAPGPSRPFDSAGVEVVEIGDLARMVCAQLELDPARIVRRQDPEAPVSRYVGDGADYQAAARGLGLTPIGIEAIVSDSIASLCGR
ncbi:NAD(P)-dependent oxidoreductase [Brevundimonas sp.]|uniref:NAD-dependent epimerase/dehydratase family protein n=1 Tax=Brevundimonas sp. TaxID=1871086 RepID=UPI002731D64C|nr:NAD(P)-dependent oxidoreductase [Brevundimonas sp.]MDP1912749.1 NAD(P)-dependent oxidoreductase [Brevundimonas sp.]